jgi:hypothetical protein
MGCSARKTASFALLLLVSLYFVWVAPSKLAPVWVAFSKLAPAQTVTVQRRLTRPEPGPGSDPQSVDTQPELGPGEQTGRVRDEQTPNESLGGDGHTVKTGVGRRLLRGGSWVRVLDEEATDYFKPYELRSMGYPNNTTRTCQYPFGLAFCCVGAVSFGGFGEWTMQAKEPTCDQVDYVSKRWKAGPGDQVRPLGDLLEGLPDPAHIVFVGDSLTH